MKTTRFRRLKVAILAIALAALVIPSGLSLTQPVSAQGKVLRYGDAEPDTIDPQKASYVDQVAKVMGLWRGLLRTDTTGTVIASIAKEVPTVENGGISKDGLTYTFHLKDWKWSDGKGMVTAGDFVYTYRRLVDPALASPYAAILNGVVKNAEDIVNGKKKPEELGIAAPDDKTVVITAEKPVSYMNSIIAMWVGGVVRKDNVERAGDPASGAWTDPANGEVVGSGPFILKSWDHQKEIVFAKNPNYSGDAAKLDEIQFVLNDEPNVKYASYKAGELDVTGVPAAEVANARADATLSKQLVEYGDTCVTYLAMDNTKPPFNNKTVRQAVASAINRDLYVKVISRGIAKPYYSFLPDAIPGNDPNAGAQFKFNPEKAKKLMADAGYPGGKGFPKVKYNYAASALNQQRFDWFQAQFKEILGIDLQANPMDGAVFQAITNEPINKPEGLTRAGWCADYLHASDYLSLVMASGDKNGDGKIEEGEGNALNISGYLSQDFDKLAKQGDNEPDVAKQNEIYKKAQEVLIDDAPVAFMNTGLNVLVVNPKVKDLKAFSGDSGYPGSYDWEAIDLQ